MPVLFIILLILGLAFLFGGIFVAALKFMIAVGIILLIIGIIGWIWRSFTGRRV
ncbi:hypothetical protein [Curtobacterium ammoniigenes]|uniref:hypothetical protein n=1 Tax=Curtobacterium ammoniigenes TaxID=395387 RepID=UPI000A9B9E62|nr:hypothetical protein [Curtobacterium ammoniigenes]